ncbi:DUF924 family protein [Sphingomonas canadensis]|uniref:DUF924 family protein n=1 Tax=Sphingomonas canadensis TaxID=1219257 RepID=A0ABW3HAZ9_9SPHN|nr:DUF924 family protein [Sphingomonas canadensis]MCW3837674.1 DUF924 domain-containing protein [Sphingomonas canadensis]
MADDLGVADRDVHAQARAVLGFWFDLVMPEQRFAKSAALDAEISTLFGGLREQVVESGAAAWRGDPETLLAAIILIDQFGRNIHRGSARAFAADPLALELARAALAKGWDAGMRAEQRQFLYLPFMHAEDPEAQAECVRLFEALGDPEPLAFARDHQAVIRRFGRFPGRNAALGRESTAEERAYLSQPGAGW